MEKITKESVEIMNAFDRKGRSAVINFLTSRYGISHYDADDILQEAWLLLLNKLQQGELDHLPQNLQAYLTTICNYKAHEWLRREEKEVRNPSFDDSSLSQEELSRYISEAQSWSDFVEESEQLKTEHLDAMYRELSNLNDKQRSLIEGFYLEGNSMTELASKLGYSNSDVAKQTKARIMRELQHTLKAA